MRKRFTHVAAALALVGCVDDPFADDLGETEQDLNVSAGLIWTSGVIPVCWETAGNDVKKGWVRDAIRKTWEAEAAIEFIGWGTCNASTSSGIRIKTADEWPAARGLGNALNNLPAGILLNFEFDVYSASFPGCRFDEANHENCIRNGAIHEFGHALGFAHEQQRPDTPSSCTDRWIWDFISGGDTLVGAWDLESVMNYCNPVWINGGKLSPTDIAGVQQMYGARKPIASVAWSPNRVDAFVHRTDNVLGSTLSGVAPFPITGAPAMVSRQPGHADVFLRGPGGTLHTSHWNGTTFSPMVELHTGKFVGSPAAVLRGNQIDVFVRGLDRSIYVTTFNGSTWSGFQGLGGELAGDLVAVASATTSDVFARGTDGAVWTAGFDGAFWSPASSLGGVIAGNPAAVHTGSQLNVFARGMNDALWTRTRSSGTWNSGFALVAPNVFLGDPVVTSWDGNRIDVFVRGFDGNLYQNVWTGSGWTGYFWLGGSFRASPTVFAPAPNRLEVLVRGADSNLYKKSWTGSAWTAFLPMGQTVK